MNALYPEEKRTYSLRALCGRGTQSCISTTFNVAAETAVFFFFFQFTKQQQSTPCNFSSSQKSPHRNLESPSYEFVVLREISLEKRQLRRRRTQRLSTSRFGSYSFIRLFLCRSCASFYFVLVILNHRAENNRTRDDWCASCQNERNEARAHRVPRHFLSRDVCF